MTIISQAIKPQTMFFCALTCLIAATSIYGASEQRTHNPGAFESISIGVPARVEWVQGTDHTVVVTTHESQINAITVDTRRGTLRLNTTRSFRGNAPVEIKVTSPNLESVSLAGSGTFVATDLIASKSVDLSVAGSGSIEARLESEKTSANIAGSGRITLSGTTDSATFKISGSGRILAADLEVSKVSANIAGSGSMNVHAKDSLTGRIAGSGVIRQSGQAEADVRVAGSGRVRTVE
ncbi:MAG: DUF2807 domain-containing protein [Verrucomicrobia bacterium]|nr:DUF2807 domain-containing protein [Verrucomicrobiota bacterium]